MHKQGKYVWPANLIYLFWFPLSLFLSNYKLVVYHFLPIYANKIVSLLAFIHSLNHLSFYAKLLFFIYLFIFCQLRYNSNMCQVFVLCGCGNTLYFDVSKKRA